MTTPAHFPSDVNAVVATLLKTGEALDNALGAYIRARYAEGKSAAFEAEALNIARANHRNAIRAAKGGR